MYSLIFLAALTIGTLPLWVSAQAIPMEIGGAPVVIITRPQPKQIDKPQFVEATVLPGEGMNLFQVKAAWPGKGIIELMHSPDLEEAKKQFESADNAFGNRSFLLGGAFLVPYANRIRGVVATDRKSITAEIADQKFELPANLSGKSKDAEVHSIHGLIYAERFSEVRQNNGPHESTASANLQAGNFDGRWPSKTDVHIKVELRDNALDLEVTAKNTGDKTLPMAIGMHPYFAIPSGDRSQARLQIPASTRILVNNYDDVFPTGQVEAVKGTPYDFTAAKGTALDKLYLDDCFTDLHRDHNGNAVVELIDPAAHYGLRITALSKRIQNIQVYAPPDQKFVAIEPQFNLADPFNKAIWGQRDTGIEYLAPGQVAEWHVRLELFIPSE